MWMGIRRRLGVLSLRLRMSVDFQRHVQLLFRLSAMGLGLLRLWLEVGKGVRVATF